MKEQIQKAFKDTVKLCGDEEKMKNIATNQGCYAYFIHGYQAALSAVPAQEPTSKYVNGWKHSCGTLMTDGVELWVDRCPHCGKPAPVEPVKQESKGHCKLGDECNCGGDLPRIRKGCSSWVMTPVEAKE